ncbi:MAG: hypothetical protein JXB10_12000 [Pirellulales bacterium]|nr:hypothetical protein [Pirellulales bacterium]
MFAIAAAMFAVVESVTPSPAEDAAPEEAVFKMREVSAFEKHNPQAGRRLTRGAYVECSTEPDKEVKVYPPLKSKQPLYGKVKFDRNLQGEGIEYHFVLDQSGQPPPGKEEKEKPEEKDNDKKTEKKPFWKSLSKKLARLGEIDRDPEHPLLKSGSLSRYDRLYFDVNHDLDLTNDPVLKPMQNPPWQDLPPWQVQEKMVFEYLDVAIDYGPGVGVRPFRILPWLTISKRGDHTYRMMHLVATTAREGQIRLGKRQFQALLAQPYVVVGRYDRPGSATALYLTPLDPLDILLNKNQYSGFTEDMLCTMRKVDGALYSITASPLGNRLTVRPYRGDFGVFQIGPGGRDLKDVTFRGSLESETAMLDESDEVREFKVPVGDYLPQYLSIQYGSLHLRISNNYHSEGKSQESRKKWNYFIKIRKDRPYVLDFCNKPDVLFASPTKDQTFRPGDEIKVSAVLIDPQLDVMIRHLDDTRQKEKKTIELGDGKTTSYERNLSLDPIVRIADSSGKTVAEGTMPFG